MKAETVLIATGIAVVVFSLYNAKQRKNDNPKIYFRKNMFGNYNGRTIPPFGIFIKESQRENKNLIEHELIHWKQYQRLGLSKFYSQFKNELQQYGYDKAPLEIEARFIENDFCKTNYTECVRNGKSLTVFNPNFLK
jgi:hypothetical protein